MPYMKDGKRDYKRENAEYNSSEEQKKNRAKRNTARRRMEADGKVSKGDGKDVAHRRALSKGGSNEKTNLTVQSKNKNRSFPRTSKGGMK